MFNNINNSPPLEQTVQQRKEAWPIPLSLAQFLIHRHPQVSIISKNQTEQSNLNNKYNNDLACIYIIVCARMCVYIL